MVRLGIICEGESETIIFNDDSFKNWLNSLGIKLISVQETGSINQFFEDRFEKHRSLMLLKNVDFILALIDLDKSPSLKEHKNKVSILEKEAVVIAVKEFESWYLADNNALSKLLDKQVLIEFPEEIQEPVKEIVKLNNGKGFGKSKPFLAKMMLRNGFSIENAAKHPNCPSAKYFINKLRNLN